MNNKQRTFLAVVFGGLSLWPVFGALADRTDTWLSASVDVYEVTLDRTADGGCAVRAFARVAKSDGGVSDAYTRQPTEVGGANRTACLDVLAKATILFKADQGL